MPPLITMLLAGTVVSVTVKLGILVAGIKVWQNRTKDENASASNTLSPQDIDSSAEEVPLAGQLSGAAVASSSGWPKRAISTGNLVAAEVAAQAQKTRQHWRIRRQRRLIQRLRSWLVSATTADPVLSAWCATVDDATLLTLAEQLTAFCDGWKIELQLVLEQQEECGAPVYALITEAILYYCRAYQQATALQEDIAVFAVFQSFLHHSQEHRQQAFGQKLFAELVDEELLSYAKIDYSSLSAGQRYAQIMLGIEAAARNDSERFLQVLKHVILEEQQAGLSHA
ncbi:MAG: hypothetical protein R3C14_43145 [Caldilineaceae bacterium]